MNGELGMKWSVEDTVELLGYLVKCIGDSKTGNHISHDYVTVHNK